MVPKRSRTYGLGQHGSATQRRSRTSSNVTSRPPRPANEQARTAEADPSRNASATIAEDTKLRELSATDVTASIEHERVELLQIQAMLKCLYEVLLYADDDDSVMHADVAHVCSRLINESVRRLGQLMHVCERHTSHEFHESAASESCGSEE